MKFTIKAINEKSLSFDVSEDTTILEIKHKIFVGYKEGFDI
jgi:hypothetical protein